MNRGYVGDQRNMNVIQSLQDPTPLEYQVTIYPSTASRTIYNSEFVITYLLYYHYNLMIVIFIIHVLLIHMTTKTLSSMIHVHFKTIYFTCVSCILGIFFVFVFIRFPSFLFLLPHTAQHPRVLVIAKCFLLVLMTVKQICIQV